MFGMPEQFPYVQCDDCKCLQIESVPSDIARYYPDNYYSFCPKPGKRDFVKALGSRLLMSPVSSLWPDTKMKRIHSWMKEAGVNYNSRILDVGCGSGGLLCQLACCGFRQLNGVDPFVDQDREYSNGVKIRKCDPLALNQEEYDLIMMHHSFEHMATPLPVLQKLQSLLSAQGTLLVRIPTVDSHAWEHYREHWFQLDAPRHFYLHSQKSMQILCEKSGLRIDRVVYDSRESQFWASEQYKVGIPHRSPESYDTCKSSSLFSQADLKKWATESKRLNQQQRGDAMALYLKKI